MDDAERAAFETKRSKMIEEAVSWPLGDYDPSTKAISPKIYSVASLPNAMEVYFKKPGIEIFNDPPNLHDLKPVVGDANKTLSFSEMWSYIARVAPLNYDNFRAIMVLIYRVCYLKDHRAVDGGYRYLPNQEIAEIIDALDSEVGEIFTYDNEAHDRFGLWGMLHMIDIVGWQEDVKYHGPGRVRTSGRKRGQAFSMSAGRENNVLSCINITFSAAKLVREIRDSIEMAKDGKNPNFRLIFDAMQGLMASKGVNPCTQTNLVNWLPEYIIRPDEHPGKAFQETLGMIDKWS